jgi:sulfite reductase (ferredoxin)
MSDEPALSKVEHIKLGSHQLRGSIAQELASGADHFEDDTTQLLKVHGIYQQDDRDVRRAKNDDGTPRGKYWMCMVRTRIPGGRLTAKQFLAELDICDRLGNGTTRLTSRQGIQHHGVLNRNLKQVVREINEIQLTTLAACGDVNRNTMSCPAPLKTDSIRAANTELSFRIAEHLRPRTTAYHDIWLRNEFGEEFNASEFKPVEEPIYGDKYLPRKFKIAIALPDDNCTDVYSNDLGFLTIAEQGKVQGYNVLVGGGMGVTPSVKKTFPALAKPMAYIAPDQVLGVAEAVVKVQRDFGNRGDRKNARLKYLIANWGVEAFKARVEEYYGRPLPAALPVDVTGVDDHIGWHEQGDGNWFLGVNIENGRIKDEADLRIKTGLRAVLNKYGMEVRITALQALILCDIKPEHRADVDSILAAHGIKRADELTLLRRYSMACPAWPTCGLAVTESERALPGILDQMEVELSKFGLLSERIAVHMTGCPNGCARPYTPDIGIVGKAAGEKYSLFLGGNAEGTRLAFLYDDFVPGPEIALRLSPVFAFYKSQRSNGESFGDFCHRTGKEAIDLFKSTWTA